MAIYFSAGIHGLFWVLDGGILLTGAGGIMSVIKKREKRKQR